LITAVPAGAQQQLERVEITGSSIKRIEGESALPVQVITREEIRKSGAINVEQLLQSVSAATSNNALTNASVAGAITGGISSASLRGLSSLRTLVLMNGRRIAPYGVGQTGDAVSVDVNSIPLAAIERIEVLKDGASAIYGSDAIAGVINFVMRRGYSGAEISATYGDTTQGGANLKRVTGSVGFGDLSKDRFNIIGVASYQKEGSLFGRDRGFAKSGIREEFNNDTSSGNTFPANIVLLDATGAPTALEGNPSAPACPPPYATLSPLFPPTVCRFDPSPLVTLIPESERASFFVAGKLAITNNLELFAEASYNRNEQRTIIQPVPISDQIPLPPNHPLFNTFPYNIPGPGTGFSTILMTPASPFYPTATVTALSGGATPDILVRWRDNINGERDFTNIAEAPRFVLGLSGAAVGWDFDAAYLHTQSKVREKVNSGYPSFSAILPILNSGTVNFWGPNTPAVESAIKATEFGDDAYKVTSTIDGVQGKVARELMSLAGGPLALALGTEYRLEKFLFDPHPAIQTGDIAGYGGNFLVTDRRRKVGAAFAEVNVPIVQGLETNFAVRFDKYEGVGSSTTPKAAVRWQPTPQMLVRGSWGQGFRAPSLQDLHLPVTTGVTAPGLSDPARCPTTGSSSDCQTQFPITVGGNTALKPERSVNATLGMVLEPVTNVSVAVDYFSIRLKDAIDNGADQPAILNDLSQFGHLVTRAAPDSTCPGCPGQIINIDQTNINIGRINLSGIDLDAKWRIPAAGAGTFMLSATGTYFLKWDEQNPDGTFTDKVGKHNAQLGGVVPRWKYYGYVDWVLGPWNVTVAHNYQRHYDDMPATFDDPTVPGYRPRAVGSYSTFDAQTTWSGIRNLRLTLGVRNIFDKDPPYTNAGGQTSFQGGYEPLYADPRGRFVYVTATYAFQ
jgi:iron complex outermembrane receptor protein